MGMRWFTNMCPINARTRISPGLGLVLFGAHFEGSAAMVTVAFAWVNVKTIDAYVCYRLS